MNRKGVLVLWLIYIVLVVVAVSLVGAQTTALRLTMPVEKNT